ncbi:transmembrane protein 121B-like [Diadema setosum]|uniref:transmembrane protein 121B-like n=1 Tax=Diadema setosum TaxID=31175 RepID=UPI003B3ACAC4
MAEHVRSFCVDVFVKVLCLVVLIAQNVLIDFYLIRFGTGTGFKRGYIWVICDSLVIVFWSVAFVMVRIRANRPYPEIPKKERQLPKELPFAYCSWLVYAGVLIAKLIKIYNSTEHPQITWWLSTSDMLTIAVSMSGLIFMLLAYSHHEDVENAKYRLQIQKLGAVVGLAILDTTDLLDMLHADSELPFHLRAAILAFGCICIVLPVFPLFALRLIAAKRSAHRRNTDSWEQVFLLKNVLFMILVDVPYFALRCHLWLDHGMSASVFLTKNLIMFLRGAFDLLDEVKICRRDRKKSRPLLELGLVVRFNK